MKKNVILVTVDTLRRDRVACYNGKDHYTPFIGSIKKNLTVFERMYSTGPYTQASFPSILTSTYYLDHGRSRHLSEDKTLISQILSANGVASAAFHSNAYLSSFFGWERGWTHFYDSMQEEVSDKFPYVSGDRLNRKIKDWLVKRKEEKPLFLWVHYMDVHEPYIPSRQYIDRVDPSLALSEDEMFSLFKEVLLKRDVSDPSKVALLSKLDAALILEVDQYISDLFGILEGAGYLDNSWVLITADHGDEFGEHGSLSHDGKFYSELIHLPFMIFDKSSQQEERVPFLTSTIDISPTILYLLGLEPVSCFKGRSLYPLESFEERGIYGEAIGKKGHQEKETDRPIYYYLEGKFKIILDDKDQLELFDLHKDPGEKENLFGKVSESEEMKDKLFSKMRSH